MTSRRKKKKKALRRQILRKQKKRIRMRALKPQKQKKWEINITGVLCAIMGIGWLLWALYEGVGYVKMLSDAMQYSKECIITEGEVLTVDRHYVEIDGKHATSDPDYPGYWVYKGDVDFSTEKGEQITFRLKKYERGLSVGQKIKVIYHPDAPWDADKPVSGGLFLRYEIPAGMSVDFMQWFYVFGMAMGGGVFLYLGVILIKGDESEPKEPLSKKIFRLQDNIGLCRAGTIFSLLFALLIFEGYVGLFNPFKVYWTEAVIEDKKLYEVIESSDQLYEKYWYDCSIVTRSGESIAGYLTEQNGNREIGDRVEVLYYEGIDAEKPLNTRERIREHMWFFLIPLGVVLLWGYYEIQYRAALEEYETV